MWRRLIGLRGWLRRLVVGFVDGPSVIGKQHPQLLVRRLHMEETRGLPCRVPHQSDISESHTSLAWTSSMPAQRRLLACGVVCWHCSGE